MEHPKRTFGQALSLARRENHNLKSLNEFLNLDFKLNRGPADDTDGERSWSMDDCIDIVRHPTSRPAIGRRTPSEEYIITTWTMEGGSRMHPPEVVDREIGTFSNLADAMFHVKMGFLKQEWYGKEEADFWAREAEREKNGYYEQIWD